MNKEEREKELDILILSEIGELYAIQFQLNLNSIKLENLNFRKETWNKNVDIVCNKIVNKILKHKI